MTLPALAVTVGDPRGIGPELVERALAIPAVAGAARYDRSRLAEVLALFRARRNEQDPVRMAMLTALVALPPGAWREGHLEDLGHILRDALDAADLSTGTAFQAECLVVALLPFHPEWSARWLTTLARERGQVHLGDLGSRLTDADVLWARIQLDLGNTGEMIGPLREALDAHPLVEPLAAMLMEALLREGRTAEAVDLYGVTRRRLAEEHGVEPGPELRRLHLSLRRQPTCRRLRPSRRADRREPSCRVRPRCCTWSSRRRCRTITSSCTRGSPTSSSRSAGR